MFLFWRLWSKISTRHLQNDHQWSVMLSLYEEGKLKVNYRSSSTNGNSGQTHTRARMQEKIITRTQISSRLCQSALSPQMKWDACMEAQKIAKAVRNSHSRPRKRWRRTCVSHQIEPSLSATRNYFFSFFLTIHPPNSHSD